MTTKQLPRIGLLGIMQELYDDMIPGITQHQENYARQVVDQLSDRVALHFPRAAKNRKDIEEIMSQFNTKGYDGVMIVNLVYGPGLNLVRALQENRLPVLLANIQPVPEITTNWDMNDLTYNQGIHGMQDTANTLLRTIGEDFTVITDDWRAASFKSFVHDWAKAAQTAKFLKSSKIAYFGKMNGMGDTIADWHSFMQVVGPEIREERMGDVYRAMEKLDKKAIEKQMAVDSKNFNIDKDMPREAHEHAVKIMLAFEKVLMDGEYAGYSANFDVFAGDGRFKQIGLLAASNLMAKGYGYGAEGDICSAALVTAGHVLHKDAQFTEMYAMDFKRNSMLMSHMGEGNWKVARKDKPVRLAYRELGIGNLDNPPTPVFMAEPGEATITSLVPLGGDHFRLVCMRGNVLDHEEYPTIEMPYYHFSPATGVREANTNWLRAGGTHHQCMLLGNQLQRWRMLCDILDIEYVEV